ncbi:hypothetical protein Trydic_g19063 [Trypoxylus dichotomus]
MKSGNQITKKPDNQKTMKLSTVEIKQPNMKPGNPATSKSSNQKVRKSSDLANFKVEKLRNLDIKQPDNQTLEVRQTGNQAIRISGN